MKFMTAVKNEFCLRFPLKKNFPKKSNIYMFHDGECRLVMLNVGYTSLKIRLRYAILQMVFN